MAKADLLDRPTKEQMALMPPFAGLTLSQIEVLRSPAQFNDAYHAIEREGLVGFDTETKPTFKKGADVSGPHVVQFALQNRAFIVQLGEQPPLPFLRSVIASKAIVKVGFGLKSDRRQLSRRLGIKLVAAVELTHTLRALRYKQTLGAKAAVAIVLGQLLQKSKSTTMSNWAVAVLKPNQLLYAANDAYAALAVYLALGSPYTPPSGSPTPYPAVKRTSSGELCLPQPSANVECSAP